MLAILFMLPIAYADVFNFARLGAIPLVSTIDVENKNRDILNSTLWQMQPGDTLVIVSVKISQLKDIYIYIF